MVFEGELPGRHHTKEDGGLHKSRHDEARRGASKGSGGWRRLTTSSSAVALRLPVASRPIKLSDSTWAAMSRASDLEIADISRRLSSDVPDVLTDLIEIASYVYCADQAVTRGGEGVLAFGAHWRRNFIFHIPVRLPSMWSSPNILDVLQKTLAILSEDTYEFRFTDVSMPCPCSNT